jgi:hypothetical protein
MRARQRSRDACSTRAAMNKAPGLPGALHLDCFSVVAFSAETGSPLFRKCFFCLVAFSAENRKSTFPENASFAWSHFPRKTGSPLFRKMLQ